jgi:hypothetical protein
MITNQELIATLIVKTGLDEQTVKGQLLAWQKEVSNALENGEDVDLYGVGRLTPRGDGLEFTPDPQLAHEVNFKYVGLAEVVQQMPEDPSKEASTEAGKNLEASEGPKATKTATSQTKTTDSVSTPKTPKKSTPSTKDDRPFDQGSPLRWVAAIVVLAAAFTLLLWQLPIQRPSIDQTMAESPSSVEEPQQSEPESSTEKDSSPLRESEAGAETESTSEPNPEATQGTDSGPKTSSEVYGLMGPYNASLETSYTIVLYSLSNRDNALAQRDELQDQSYRAFAREKLLNSGTVTTQVCVGQFEGFEEAVNAANASFGEAGINFFISAHSQAILE